MASQPLEIRARMRDQISSPLRRIQDRIRRFGTSVKKAFLGVAKRIFSIRAALGAVLSGGLFVAWQKRIADSGVDLDTWATKLGVSVEKLSALQFAVETSGFEFDNLREGLKTLQERMDDAARGNVTYSEQFARLGVSVTDTDGRLRNVVDLLPELAEGFRRVAGRGGAQELVLITEDLIGGTENLLSVWLQQGPEAIQAAMRRAREVNAILGRSFTDASNRFASSWAEAAAVVRGVVADMFTAIEPYLTVATRMVREMLTAFRSGGANDPRAYFDAIRSIIAGAVSGVVRFATRITAGVQRFIAMFLEGIELVVNAFLIGMLKIEQAVVSVELGIRELFGEDVSARAEEFEQRASRMYGRFDAGASSMRASAAATEALGAAMAAFGARTQTAIPWLDEYLDRVRAILDQQSGGSGGGGSGPLGGGGGQGSLMTWFDAFRGQMKQVRSEWTNFKQVGQDAARSVGAAMSDGLTNSIANFLRGVSSAKEAIASFKEAVIAAVVQMIARYTALVILAALFSAFTGGGGLVLGALSSISGIGGMQAARGASFDRGGVRRFALGGVVDRTTPFLYAGGRRAGVMGEAGPEAIMPLRRGRGGRLGVEAVGGGGGTVIHQTNNFNGDVGDRSAREDMARLVRQSMLEVVGDPRIRRSYKAGRFS